MTPLESHLILAGLMWLVGAAAWVATQRIEARERHAAARRHPVSIDLDHHDRIDTLTRIHQETYR